jgi:hypothetical protein
MTAPAQTDVPLSKVDSARSARAGKLDRLADQAIADFK